MKFIKINELCENFKCSPDSIYRWIRMGEFPKPVKLGRRMSAWNVDDVNRWLETRGGA